MKEPILVVLAAGMGSRYGGLKQLEAIGPNQEIMLEYSIYDALQAGFKRVVFIIKKAIEKEFKEMIGSKVHLACEVEYVYQELDRLPEGCVLPEGRVKPWGTSHALMCCKDVIDAPFAVINADDYYGQSAFVSVYEFLIQNKQQNMYAMVGYPLMNTLSEHGSVARGICQCEHGLLTSVRELTNIEVHGDSIEYTLDEGNTWKELQKDALVSMNMWAFKESILSKLEQCFILFYQQEVPQNPLKAEDLIPIEIGKMLQHKEIKIQMLSSKDKWYGITYQEDKPHVIEGIKKLVDEGKYPIQLWK